MAYEQRVSGRDWEELRPIEAKAGVIKRAVGSGWFKIGGTEAFAAVFGPREVFPKFLKNPEKGILRCHYNMMPFSSAGDRIRPGPSRRSKEISMVTEKALLPVLDLDDFPNAGVDLYIELPQTDAGTRCAGICAASIALADAGIPMKDLVCAVSAGKVEDKMLLDLDYPEDSHEHGVDIPMAVLHNSGKISLLQMDGEISLDELKRATVLARKGADKIYDVMKQALKDKFQVE
ncbi:exosome complex exonuclease Rrp41 [Candidatus Woesearchaeota archaeon]|nr:exosome complex exonuclease Rrp41 [Candidatus Woesearchaeota archaeon]